MPRLRTDRSTPPRASAVVRAISPIAASLLVVGLLGGCAATTEMGPPQPTPADMAGIAAVLKEHGITVRDLVSGDAGCSDPDMVASAIGFDASGLDQETAVPVHLFIFRNAQSYQKQRPAVDACAATWVTDPDAYEAIDSQPYVLVGQGPWGPEFRTALRSALAVSAGNGG